MDKLDLLQSVYFDICDLIYSNPKILNRKIAGLPEFNNLGEFLQYQKAQIEEIEWANNEKN